MRGLRGAATVLAVLLALALMLGGCGDSSDSSSKAPLYTYPDAIKSAFMDSCTASASRAGVSVDQAQSACACAVTELENRVPASDVGQIGQPDAPESVSRAAQAAIENCK